MIHTRETLKEYRNLNTLVLVGLLLYIISPAIYKAWSGALPGIEGYGSYSQPVRAGEVVNIKWSIVKRTACEGFVGRVWNGAEGFYLSETLRGTGIEPSPIAINYTIPTLIPEAAPIGELRLTIEGYYQCSYRPKEHFVLGPVILNVVK